MTWHDDDGFFRAAVISYDDINWAPFSDEDLSKCEPAITDMHGDGMFDISALPQDPDWIPWVYDNQGNEAVMQHVTVKGNENGTV